LSIIKVLTVEHIQDSCPEIPVMPRISASLHGQTVRRSDEGVLDFGTIL
jgi:hypothetical protein